MGKRTLYHPVSLHVLRGALEYCGIKLGRLVQIGASLEEEKAYYRATIINMPDALRSYPTWDIAKELQECFAQDVTVLSVTSEYHVKRKNHTLTATLLCDVHEVTPMESILSEKQRTEVSNDFLSDIPF